LVFGIIWNLFFGIWFFFSYMRILGIDPGFDRIGVAIVEKESGSETLVYSTCIVTNRADTFVDRLVTIATELRVLIEEYHPNTCAIETLLFAANKKTAMQVSEARGAILLVAREASLDILEYSPLQIKTAITGYGKAEKSQVDMMVRQLVAVPEGKRIDDEMDAIAVGLTGLASIRFPQE
jgi:crossover junction endodeoxyribonuclease RuvC